MERSVANKNIQLHKKKKSGIIFSIIKDARKKKGLLLLALPGLLFLFIFNYIPMFGVFIAFKRIDFSKGIFGSPWVGFDNFKSFFQSENMIRVTRNTLLLNLLFISVTFVLSIIFALMLFELSKRAVKLYQSVLFAPYLLSWVMISYIAYILLNSKYGVINAILTGLGRSPIDWYTVPRHWPVILLISYVWKNVGYMTIIFYTGLMGIDSTYYEASQIDGANRIQQIFKITIPCLAPLICILLLRLFPIQLLLISIMRNLEYVRSMNQVTIATGNLPTEAVRMAICILAAGPMTIIFPFFQKYFVKGLVVGAVKV